MKGSVGVLGGGAWGTAIAKVLANNGYRVHLWCYEPSVVASISRSSENKLYLPKIKLSRLIEPTNVIADLFEQADIIFEAVPVAYMRNILSQAKQYTHDQHSFVILSKGIEQQSLFLPSQIIQDVVGPNVQIAAVAGPSFARELAEEYLTAVSVACPDDEFATVIACMLKNEYCCPFVRSDLIGVQSGGAFKNVLSLGLGILDGARCADNTKALIFTLGLNEMTLLSEALGGKKETMYGLSGLGDLILTSRGNLSRNSYLGRCLGKGKSLEKIVKKMGTMPEGVNTVQSVCSLMRKYCLDLPVFEGIEKMVFGNWCVEEFLDVVVHKLSMHYIFCSF